MLLSLAPYAAGTFFPFTSFRPPVYPPPRYRSSRSSPQNNFVPLQSSVLGVRVLVPRALYDLFNVRSPYSPPINYPRPPPPAPPPYQPSPYPRPYNPFNPPIDFQPENHPLPFSPANGYSPGGRGFPPSINPTTFFNLMRAFYPNLIYRPDPRYPNVFAIRFPTEPNPPNPPDFYRDPLGLQPPPQPATPPVNPEFNEDLPPNDGEFFEPPLPSREFTPPPLPQQPPLLPQQATQQTQNQQLPFGRSPLPFNTNNNNFNSNNFNSAQRRSPPNLIFIRS